MHSLSASSQLWWLTLAAESAYLCCEGCYNATTPNNLAIAGMNENASIWNAENVPDRLSDGHLACGKDCRQPSSELCAGAGTNDWWCRSADRVGRDSQIGTQVIFTTRAALSRRATTCGMHRTFVADSERIVSCVQACMEGFRSMCAMPRMCICKRPWVILSGHLCHPGLATLASRTSSSVPPL